MKFFKAVRHDDSDARILAAMADIDEAVYQRVKQALARHFLEDHGAPAPEAAAAAAADECTYTQCRARRRPSRRRVDHGQREPSEDGAGERNSVFKPLMIGTHKLGNACAGLWVMGNG